MRRDLGRQLRWEVQDMPRQRIVSGLPATHDLLDEQRMTGDPIQRQVPLLLRELCYLPLSLLIPEPPRAYLASDPVRWPRRAKERKGTVARGYRELPRDGHFDFIVPEGRPQEVEADVTFVLLHQGRQVGWPAGIQPRQDAQHCSVYWVIVGKLGVGKPLGG